MACCKGKSTHSETCARAPGAVKLPKGWFMRDVNKAAKRAAMWSTRPR